MEHLKLPIYFAPIQGYTDVAYRNAHASFCGGIDEYYAPFLRIEHAEVRKKELRDIEPTINQTSLVPQIIAGTIDEFRILSRELIRKGYKRIDINMGCPFPMQTRLCRGAGILQYPEKVTAILEEIRKLSEIEMVDFSVKMRLGMNDAYEWQDIIPLFNKSTLTHITIHPRIGKQQYKGNVDMESFARLYESCEKPLIYNGDLMSCDDIAQIADRYPRLKGVMIGRGLLARPTMAYEYQNDITYENIDVCDRIMHIHSKVLEFYERTLEGGASQILQKIQAFWDYPQIYFDKHFIKQIRKTTSLDKYKQLY